MSQRVSRAYIRARPSPPARTHIRCTGYTGYTGYFDLKSVSTKQERALDTAGYSPSRILYMGGKEAIDAAVALGAILYPVSPDTRPVGGYA